MTLKPEQMRITQVMLSRGMGGGERICIDISLALADAGHRIQAVCHPEFEGRHLFKHSGIEIHPLKVRWDYSPVARRRLCALIKDFRPHIVHTHMARASMVGGAAGQRCGVPIVANMHDYAKLKYYRNIDHFFPGTEDLKAYLVKKAVDPQQITMIPHFSRIVPVDAVAPFSPGLVGMGRFSPEKGFDLLIQALGILKSRGVELPLELGGDGPEKPRLERMVKQLSLDGQVRFAGWISDVAAFLRKGSIFVLPSRRESFGIAVLEAMSQGRIIVAAMAPGPLEILDDTTAFFFPVGDASALADRIQEVLANPDDANLRAHNALNRFTSYYGVDTVMPHMEACYRNMINRKPSPR